MYAPTQSFRLYFDKTVQIRIALFRPKPVCQRLDFDNYEAQNVFSILHIYNIIILKMMCVKTLLYCYQTASTLCAVD